MEPLPNEREWILRFKNGDPAAFERIMVHYEVYVLALMLRMTGGKRDLAEDLCQETFLKVLKGLSRFRHKSSLKTWIFRVAHNTAADHLRARREEPAVEEDAAAEIQDTSVSLEEALDQKRLREWILLALDQLHPSQGEVLNLYYWAGFSVEEIAHVTGAPVGTVKTHLHRGRSALRQRIANLVEERSS
ncbi:MAG: RNA polymerase sigma factor [Acidobacteriota bacterium]